MGGRRGRGSNHDEIVVVVVVLLTVEDHARLRRGRLLLLPPTERCATACRVQRSVAAVTAHCASHT
jgi:hypothetical protein